MASKTNEVDQDLEDSRDDFDLKCPVCFKFPRDPPVYQCSNGHIMCTSCHDRLSDCPICRIKLEGKIRNRVAEKLLEKIPLSCQFEEEGCLVVLKKTELRIHEKECEYRAVICPCCNDKIMFSDIAEHLYQSLKDDMVHATLDLRDGQAFEHEVTVTADDLQARESCQLPIHLMYDNRHFYVECFTFMDNVYIWIYCLGPKDVSRRYRYAIKIEKNGRQISFSDSPISIDKKKRNIAQKASCLVLPQSAFQKFWSPDTGKIKIHASVTMAEDQNEIAAEDSSDEEEENRQNNLDDESRQGTREPLDLPLFAYYPGNNARRRQDTPARRPLSRTVPYLPDLSI